MWNHDTCCEFNADPSPKIKFKSKNVQNQGTPVFEKNRVAFVPTPQFASNSSNEMTMTNSSLYLVD